MTATYIGDTSVLSPVRVRLLRYIADYKQDHDFAPSYREMRDALKMPSLGAIHYHIQTLEASGWLKRDIRNARSIQLPGGRYTPPDWIVELPG